MILFDTVKAYSDFPAGIVANESCGSILAACEPVTVLGILIS